VGSEEELQTEVKNRTVDISIVNIMYAFKTRKQVQHKHKRPSDAFRILIMYPLSHVVNPCKRDHEFEVNSGGVAESYQLSTLGG